MTHPILDIALDAFNAFDRDQNPDAFIDIRSMMLDLSDHTLTIARCNELDDCAIIHLDLDDELAELTMIAIFDRSTNELRSLILDSDSTTMIIPLP